MNNLVQTTTWFFAVSFLLAFIISLFPNPIVGPEALFETNFLHDVVHLLTAIGFIIVALMSAKASIVFMKLFGIVYLAVGILGFIVLGDAERGSLLGLIHINTLDNYLHVGLGITILASGMMLSRQAEVS